MVGMMRSSDLECAPGSKKALVLAWSSLKSTLLPSVHHDAMAGSKRNKVKKLLSPTRAVTPPPEPSLDDDALMDDLMAQLDARDSSHESKQEAATVLGEMGARKTAEQEAAPSKQDSKSRHQARMVCRDVVECPRD